METSLICAFLCLRIMVINMEQKKLHFDLRFFLTYNRDMMYENNKALSLCVFITYYGDVCKSLPNSLWFYEWPRNFLIPDGNLFIC